MARKPASNHPWHRQKGIAQAMKPIREYHDPDGTLVRVYPPFTGGLTGELFDEEWLDAGY